MRLEQLTAQALKATNNNRYLLSTAVSKRVQQILDGAPTYLNRDISKEEPTNVAIEEIAKGLIEITLD